MNIAHTFKSSSRTIGALQLGELCASIETACANQKIESIAGIIMDFRQELDKVLSELNNWQPV